MLKSLKKFIVETINYNFCPFIVYSPEFGKSHYCWDYNQVTDWLKCYDAKVFGSVLVLGFNRDIIAVKGV